MRKLIAALLIAVLPLAGGFAQEKKDDTKQDKKAKLAIGDAAPPLKNVTAWLNGNEPKLFEKDKVYVLAFFAYWYVDSLEDIPYLGELQKANADKGLVAIGVTKQELKGKSKEQVSEFVKPFGFPVAYCDSEENAEAYVKQTGLGYMPWAVVGMDGKIAYIGRAMYIDEVLPKVLEGTWKGQADVDAMDARRKELGEVVGQATAETKAEKLQAFLKKYPESASSDEVVLEKLSIVVTAQKFEDAKPIIEEMIAIAEKKKSARLVRYAVALADPRINPEKKQFELVTKAIDTAVKYGGSDENLLVSVFEAYVELGNKEKATAAGNKLIETVPDFKVYVEKKIKKFEK